MRVLVVYGTSNGGTAGLAEMIGDAFVSRGFDVDVRSAERKPDPSGYDAVVIGGALYAMRWNKHARRYVKRQAAVLRTLPVWLFSSGPLDDSAATSDIPPVGHVVKAIDLIGARGHMTFGGRLEPDVKGFPASAMAKKNAGDWRDPAHVDRWVEEIASQLAVSAS